MPGAWCSPSACLRPSPEGWVQPACDAGRRTGRRKERANPRIRGQDCRAVGLVPGRSSKGLDTSPGSGTKVQRARGSKGQGVRMRVQGPVARGQRRRFVSCSADGLSSASRLALGNRLASLWANGSRVKEPKPSNPATPRHDACPAVMGGRPQVPALSLRRDRPYGYRLETTDDSRAEQATICLAESCRNSGRGRCLQSRIQSRLLNHQVLDSWSPLLFGSGSVAKASAL